MTEPTLQLVPSPEEDRRDRLRHLMGLLSEDDVARMLGVTTHTLKMWRIEKKGPSYTKLGRQIFYRLTDLQVWAGQNTVHHEPAALAG